MRLFWRFSNTVDLSNFWCLTWFRLVYFSTLTWYICFPSIFCVKNDLWEGCTLLEWSTYQKSTSSGPKNGSSQKIFLGTTLNRPFSHQCKAWKNMPEMRVFECCKWHSNPTFFRQGQDNWIFFKSRYSRHKKTFETDVTEATIDLVSYWMIPDQSPFFNLRWNYRLYIMVISYFVQSIYFIHSRLYWEIHDKFGIPWVSQKLWKIR